MSVEIVGEVLQQVLTTRNVWNSRGDSEKVRGEISSASCAKLQELVGLVDARRTLEVGCATGVSTLAILSNSSNLAVTGHTSPSTPIKPDTSRATPALASKWSAGRGCSSASR